MARLQTDARQRLLLALGVLLNVGAVGLAALAALQGDWPTTLWWLAVAVGWLVVLRVVLGRSASDSPNE